MKNKKGLLYSVLSISLLTVMAGAAMAPALGVIRDNFSDWDAMTIQLIVSLPALFIIATSLCFRSVSKHFKTKTIALTGLVIYVVSGAGAYMVDSMYVLLVLRALLGVGVGLIMPLSTGLLTYYFPPEEQSRLMGLSAAMNQMGGVLATMLAGVLASIKWNYAFLVYLAGLVAIVLVVLFLPNDSLVDGTSTKKDVQHGNARLMKRIERRKFLRSLVRFHPSITSMFLIMVLFFVYPTNFALTARSHGMDTLAITLIMVSLDVVAFVIGLIFAIMMKHFMKAMKFFPPVLFFLGYLCLALGDTVGSMILGSLLIGIANGVGVPYVNTIAGIKGGKDAATTVMPLISASLYLGQFLSPLIVNPLSTLFDSGGASYWVASIIALIYLLQTFLTRKHHALPPISKQ